jgi:predicted peroxiredoxin
MRYLFVESRSERESPDVEALFDLAGQLRDAGHDVTLFLVQNAVAAAGSTGVLGALVRRGVDVLVDDRSLADRGLAPAPLPGGARPAGMPELVRLLMTPDVVATWH